MKKSKKLIALLSVCCMAMAATALVGCAEDGKDGINGTNGTNGENGAPGKSAYELAVESGFVGTLEEWLESLKAPVEAPHEHEYGEMVTIIAPTGVDKGVGLQTCPVDGDQKVVILDALKGVIPGNPIEISAGETLTVAVNDYEGPNKTVSGEKGVMYFKMTTYQGGNVALPTSAANVEYSFYYADTYNDDDMMFSRNVWVDEGAGDAKDIWIKAVFTGEYPAEVEVTGQITAVGKQKNTITLSQGAAAEGETLSVKVYSIWGYEITLSRDDTDLEIQDFDENLTAWVKVDPAEEEFTFEIVGLADEYCVLDASELYMNFPEDGSKDKGGEYFVHIGRQYEYAVTVKNGDTVLAGVGVVAYNPMNGYVSATTDENGVATFLLPETLNDNGETVFDWTVNISGDFGFGYAAPVDAVALAPETDNCAVTISPVAIDVPVWTADGTKYPAPVRQGSSSMIGRVTLTAEEAGEYTLTLTSANQMFSAVSYDLTVNDQTVSVGDPSGWDLSTTLTANFNLVEGANNITVALSTATSRGFVYAFDVFLTKVAPVTPPEEGGETDANALELGVEKTVSTGSTYSFTAPADASYVVTFSGAIEYTSIYASQEDYDNWGDPLLTPDDATKQIKLTMAAGDVQTFYIDTPDGDITMIVNDDSVLELGVEKTVSTDKTYTFTAPADGTYIVTISGATDYTSIYASKEDYDNWGDPLLTPDVATKQIELTMTADQVQTFYIDTPDGDITMVVKDANAIDISVAKTVSTDKTYSFTAPADGTYIVTFSGATDYTSIYASKEDYDNWGDPLLTPDTAAKSITLEMTKGQVQTFYIDTPDGDITVIIEVK